MSFEEEIYEEYRKARLRDLGFKGMSADEQAEKVLREYRAGWRGIIAYHSEHHRVLLIPRVWRPYIEAKLALMADHAKDTVAVFRPIKRAEKAKRGRRSRKGWKK